MERDETLKSLARNHCDFKLINYKYFLRNHFIYPNENRNHKINV